MKTMYDESFSNTDQFGKESHISDSFSPAGGFSMIAQLITGKTRAHILNLRDGEETLPDGLWTLTEATRLVRSTDKR